MGMFDWYDPGFSIECPSCRSEKNHGQGKDGPNGLFLWKALNAAPVDQLVDDECKLTEIKRNRFRLPSVFDFDVYCDECHAHLAIVKGICEDGIWTRSVIRRT